MKIKIITLHCPMNCGSVLQGFALCRFLQNKYGDTNVELIDYVPKYMETEGRAFRSFIRKMVFFFPYNKRKKNFNDFIDSNCNLTEKKYFSYKELEIAPPKADVYITGSDQLWNPCFPCGKDKAYYLDFINNSYKIAYATSLGNDLYSNDELTMIANNAKDYRFISLREKCSVDQMHKIGMKDVEWVCDPTLLLSRSYYDKLAIDYSWIGKYVAVYLVDRSPLLDKILSLFKKNGYKIVGVGGYLKKYDCDIHLMDAGPAEFLGLIRDSSFVVATSFHATVFSLIFEKKFAIIPPKINPARIEQLLDFINEKNRIITDVSQLEDTLNPIPYKQVNEKLSVFIEKSKSILINEIDKAGV